MKQIIEVCREEKIPVVAEFQYCDDEENGPGFVTTVIVTDDQEPAKKMYELARAVQPQRSVVIAETIQTKPDGSKIITSRLVQ